MTEFGGRLWLETDGPRVACAFNVELGILTFKVAFVYRSSLRVGISHWCIPGGLHHAKKRFALHCIQSSLIAEPAHTICPELPSLGPPLPLIYSAYQTRRISLRRRTARQGCESAAEGSISRLFQAAESKIRIPSALRWIIPRQDGARSVKRQRNVQWSAVRLLRFCMRAGCCKSWLPVAANHAISVVRTCQNQR